MDAEVDAYFFFDDFFEDDFFDDDADFFELFFDDDFFEPDFFDEDFFDEDFLEEDFFDDFFDGTLPPSRRASDNPIAIACFRLVTFLPEPPLFSVPRFRSCIAFSTLSCAFFPYFAAMLHVSFRCAQKTVQAASRSVQAGREAVLTALRFFSCFTPAISSTAATTPRRSWNVEVEIGSHQILAVTGAAKRKTTPATLASRNAIHPRRQNFGDASLAQSSVARAPANNSGRIGISAQSESG